MRRYLNIAICVIGPLAVGAWLSFSFLSAVREVCWPHPVKPVVLADRGSL